MNRKLVYCYILNAQLQVIPVFFFRIVNKEKLIIALSDKFFILLYFTHVHDTKQEQHGNIYLTYFNIPDIHQLFTIYTLIFITLIHIHTPRLIFISFHPLPCSLDH